MSGLKPGWYANDGGEKKFWDGNQWLKPTEDSEQHSDETVNSTKLQPKRPRRLVWSVLSALVILGLVLVGFKMFGDYQIEQERIAATERAQKNAEAAKQRQEKREAELAVEEAEAEKEFRAEAVAELEENVKKLAVEHATEGLLSNKPVGDVSCTPTGLSEDDERGDSSTRYSCFVPTEHAGGDEYLGTNYYGLINWDTGEMNYGYGR